MTKEQEAIMNHDYGILKINAKAGSGKTTTIKMWCEKHSHLKILYLVFGKAMSDEATKLFKNIKNVEVRTTHSLAFKSFGLKYKSKLTQNFTIQDVMQTLNIKKDYELANMILDIFNKYLSSDSEDISEFTISEIFNNIKSHYTNSVSKLCKKLWDKSYDLSSDTKVTHDFYLKLYQLSKPNLVNDFDVIIVDEVQDQTLSLKSILENSNVKTQILIGDQHQSIFKFRNCVNLFDYIVGKELPLSNSFRVSNNVANLCNNLFGNFGFSFKMTGSNENSNFIFYEEDVYYDNVNIICRNNATILKHAIYAVLQNKYLYFEGGIKSYPFDFYKDLFWFLKTGKSFNPKLCMFNGYEDFIRYLDESEDIELNNAFNIIRTVSKDVKSKLNISFPELINMIKESAVTKKENADVKFVTAHKSKGLTFNNTTFITSDFKINEINSDEFGMDLSEEEEQEINLFYVALTRCKSTVIIPNKYKKFL